MFGAPSALMGGRVVFGADFGELMINRNDHGRQVQEAARWRAPSQPARPGRCWGSCPGAPCDACAGCRIREVVAPPRPPPSANELKLREELARLKRENERLKAPRRSGRARPPDAIVETKSDDDDADEATAQERNRRLAEEIGAPVCLWGRRTCGASATRRWIRKRKGRGQKRPGRGGNSPLRTTRRLRGPRRLSSPRPRPPPPGSGGPQPPAPLLRRMGGAAESRAAEAEFNARAAQHAAARAREPAPAPKLPSLTMVTLEEAKRYSLPEQRLSLIVLLECHLEDLQKRDKGDYYWSTLTASDLSVESIARESLFKWFESELLSGFEHDRRIKNLGSGFRGLCREVERRIRMLTTAVAAPVARALSRRDPPCRPLAFANAYAPARRRDLRSGRS